MKKWNISVVSDDFAFDSLAHVMSDNPLYFTVLRSRSVDGLSLGMMTPAKTAMKSGKIKKSGITTQENIFVQQKGNINFIQ